MSKINAVAALTFNQVNQFASATFTVHKIGAAAPEMAAVLSLFDAELGAQHPELMERWRQLCKDAMIAIVAKHDNKPASEVHIQKGSFGSQN